VDRKYHRVIVDGLNMVNKRIPGSDERRAGMFKVESPIHYSNVNLVDPVTKKPTRVRMRYLETGERVRLAVKSGAILPKPVELKARRARRSPLNEKTDTPVAAVLEQTYFPAQDAGLVLHNRPLAEGETPAQLAQRRRLGMPRPRKDRTAKAVVGPLAAGTHRA
jgi:large subunit ribosomal protein L24